MTGKMCYEVKIKKRPDKNRKPRHLKLKQKFNDIFEDFFSAGMNHTLTFPPGVRTTRKV